LEKGNFKVLTSLSGWQTPFGKIFPDELIIEGLLAENLVEVDEEVLKNEHAVGALLPFLKLYLPETTVVPLVLSGRLDFEEIGVLAQKLLTYQKEGVIILASIDFSHHLRSEEARSKDDLTLRLIESFNYREILALDDRYLDSPPALVTILMMAEKLGKNGFEVFYHTNSGEVAKNEWLPTTSYCSGAFY
jgi:AmmeMemoRadiSam system protein B